MNLQACAQESFCGVVGKHPDAPQLFDTSLSLEDKKELIQRLSRGGCSEASMRFLFKVQGLFPATAKLCIPGINLKLFGAEEIWNYHYYGLTRLPDLSWVAASPANYQIENNPNPCDLITDQTLEGVRNQMEDLHGGTWPTSSRILEVLEAVNPLYEMGKLGMKASKGRWHFYGLANTSYSHEKSLAAAFLRPKFIDKVLETIG